MNNRISDDPRNLARECDAWDWARTAGASDQQLCDSLVAGPTNAPRRRNGERPADSAARPLARFHRR